MLVLVASVGVLDGRALGREAVGAGLEKGKFRGQLSTRR